MPEENFSHPPDPPDPMTELERIPERRAKLLVVDDMPLLLNSLSRRLGKEFDVTCATGGLEALDILAGPEEYSVIICDYQMPEMNGIDVLARVASRHPEVSRVILTGSSKLDLAVDVLNAVQIHRFLCKPCPEDELFEAVRTGVDVHLDFIEEEIERGELEFTNQSLSLLNRNLEERVHQQGESISCFRRLAAQLNRAVGLEGVARVSSEAAFDVLGGRGVFIQIADDSGTRVEYSMGPEMSACMVSEPLATHDGPIGEMVVDVLGPDGRKATTADQNMLAAIASIAAVAAHNEFRRRERDDAQYATVVALARLSEQRDQETGLHLERVSSYCRLIAESLVQRGLHTDVIDARFLDDIVRSAPLHDIGKVGIPDSILLKKGKLTPSEWEVMKTHAQIGADTLRSVADGHKAGSYLQMGLDIAQCHHERWDGSGYPGGLTGTQIPLSARILALADVYDALTSVRPYKGAWSHEESVALIEENRASHFDPQIVDAFLASQQQAAEIRTRLADEGQGQQPILGPIGKIA